ncbi:MAG: polyprenyl synthetase [Flavobacterium sp. BFFFF2]|nr:MAG: polyprenyl synthetase [Flavobacterium sp. BFFFF2]
MDSVSTYHQILQTHFSASLTPNSPKSLYEPVDYIMQLGGKRMRPVLALLGCELFGGNTDDAIHAAKAIEIFHNFSLVHDDIMDDAPLRRGHETVHEKWNMVTAILSGDVMVFLAYENLLKYPTNQAKMLIELFTNTGREVCEGQQWDMDFEKMEQVSLTDYLNMIRCKTAVLLGASLQMGAIVAAASEESQKYLYDFGIELGLAFQILDDYLDAFGDPATFGKQVGGDIIANKKTYIFIKALALANVEQAQQLTHLFAIEPADPTDKINTVKQLFTETGAVIETRKAIEQHTQNALSLLQKLDIDQEKKQLLEAFSLQLMGREV